MKKKYIKNNKNNVLYVTNFMFLSFCFHEFTTKGVQHEQECTH